MALFATWPTIVTGIAIHVHDQLCDSEYVPLSYLQHDQQLVTGITMDAHDQLCDREYVPLSYLQHDQQLSLVFAMDAHS